MPGPSRRSVKRGKDAACPDVWTKSALPYAALCGSILRVATSRGCQIEPNINRIAQGSLVADSLTAVEVSPVHGKPAGGGGGCVFDGQIEGHLHRHGVVADS